MLGNVYAKTAKGRDEIATRRARLPARLRSLLVIIDGARSLEELVKHLGPAAALSQNAAVLSRDGFIEVVGLAAPPPPPLPVPSPPPARAPLAPPLPAASMHDIYSSRRR